MTCFNEPSPYVLHGQLEPLVLAAVTVAAYQEVHMMSIVHGLKISCLSRPVRQQVSTSQVPQPSLTVPCCCFWDTKKCQRVQWKLLSSHAATCQWFPGKWSDQQDRQPAVGLVSELNTWARTLLYSLSNNLIFSFPSSPSCHRTSGGQVESKRPATHPPGEKVPPSAHASSTSWDSSICSARWS